MRRLVLCACLAGLGCGVDAPRAPGRSIPTRAELAAQGPTLSCTLDRWEDGDTPYVRCGTDAPSPVRLIGIDTAESGFDDDSRRRASWQQQLWGMSYDEVIACGKAATERAEALCPPGREVAVVGHERDRYGRRLAYVICDGLDLNLQLWREGLAGAYPFPDPPDRPAACPGRVTHR